MREAAQRFRDELERLSRIAVHLCQCGPDIRIRICGVAYTFQAQQLFAGYPAWQLYVLLGALIAAGAYALYRLLRTVRSWRQVKYLHDANIAIGHLLHRIASGTSRVYHDVSTAAGVVDHVVIGQGGIYAVNVVARRSARHGGRETRGQRIEFLVHGARRDPILEIAAKSTRLEQDFSKLLKNSVRVRSVIAVPGWHVESQPVDGHLLVNERTLAMFQGWKDESDYLMNEDVDVLQKHLTATCKRSRPLWPRRK